MTLVANNYLTTITSDSVWAGLVAIEAKTWLDLGKLTDAQKKRIGNGIARGMYSGRRAHASTNVAVFRVLCEACKVPYVLKGMNDGLFPVVEGREFEFAQAVKAFMLLSDGDRPETVVTPSGHVQQHYIRADYIYVHTTGAEREGFRKGHDDLQLGKYPLVTFDAPKARWDGILKIYNAGFKPPQNLQGVRDALRYLIDGHRIEVPLKFFDSTPEPTVISIVQEATE